MDVVEESILRTPADNQDLLDQARYLRALARQSVANARAAVARAEATLRRIEERSRHRTGRE